MVHKYVRIKVSINDDPDFEALSLEAQWLYQRVLLTHPSLSACGVVDWRPKRLLGKAANVSYLKIQRAAAELERARFVLFDLESEEALVRTYIRHDEPLRNPRMAAAVITAYQGIGSQELRAAVVSEIVRERAEHPEYSSWDHKDTTEGLNRILTRPVIATVGYTDAYEAIDGDRDSIQVADPAKVPNGDPASVANANADSVRNGYATSVQDTVVDPGPERRSEQNTNLADFLPSTFSPQPSALNQGGYVSGVRHQRATPLTDDPPRCPKHEGVETPPDCGGCAEVRKRRDREAADLRRQVAEQRAADVQAAAELRRGEIARCGLCDADGYAGGRVCDHDPDSAERARRGAAGVRAVLAAKRAEKAAADPEEQTHA